MQPTLQEIRTSAIPSAIPSTISRRILRGAATLVLALGAASALAQAALPTVEVFKSPYCGCCTDWVKHMQAAGFTVKVHNVDDTQAARAAAGMPDSLALTQHGQPVAAQGATGKLTWLAGGKKSEALLAPAGDNKLAAKGDFKAPATAVAVVTLPGQAPTTVRFAIK